MRAFFLDGPAALWDRGVAAVRWLADGRGALVSGAWVGFWLAVAMMTAACFIAVAIVLMGALLGRPWLLGAPAGAAAVIPAGGRAAGDGPPTAIESLPPLA